MLLKRGENKCCSYITTVQNCDSCRMIWCDIHGVQLHPLHLRFLLFPGAFSLLCFSDGKCFVTRDWNTPLKERGRGEKDKRNFYSLCKPIRTTQGVNTVAVRHCAFLIRLIIPVRCWQTDEHVVCDLIYSDIQACLIWEVWGQKVKIPQHLFHPFLVFLREELH